MFRGRFERDIENVRDFTDWQTIVVKQNDNYSDAIDIRQGFKNLCPALHFVFLNYPHTRILQFARIGQQRG